MGWGAWWPITPMPCLANWRRTAVWWRSIVPAVATRSGQGAHRPRSLPRPMCWPRRSMRCSWAGRCWSATRRVARATALKHPQKVSGLALIAPLTHMPADGPSEVFAPLTIRQGWLRAIFAWTLMVPLSIRRREQALDVVFGPEKAPADFPLRGGGALGLRPTHYIASSRDLVALEHVLPQLEQSYSALQTPVRILYGRDD